MRHLSIKLGVLLLGLLNAVPAAAQDQQRSARGKEAAIALAEQGWSRYEAGRYAEALSAFRQAESTVHAPPFLLMVARCYDKLGRLLEARSVYRLVVDERLAKNAPREFVEAQQNAVTELEALQSRIPTVEVRVKGTAELTLDELPIQPSVPVELDPGEHRLSARSPGRLVVTRTFRLTEGTKERIDLDATQPEAAAAGAPGRGVAGTGLERGGEGAWWDDAGTRRAILIGGGVATGLGVGMGIVFTVLANNKASEGDELWNQVDSYGKDIDCRTEVTYRAECAALADARDQEVLLGNLGVGLFVGAGAVGVGTLIYGLVTGQSSASDRRVQVTPVVGTNHMGISVGGAF